MSRNESLAGDSSDAGSAQEGNRPAQNARLTTPGSLSTQGYQGGDGAADFLGLDAEVGGNSGAFDLMAQADSAAMQEAAPEPSAWVETDRVRERAAEVRETARQEADEVETDEPFESEEEVDSHGDWSESAPKRGGSGKLIGAAAGVLVLGALGVAGMKFMGGAGEAPSATGPLAARPTPKATQNAGLAAGVALDGPSDLEPDEFDTVLEPIMEAPADGMGEYAEAPVDPDAARQAFEETRGDEPPAWFDPTLDSLGEPAQTGWSDEAEAVTRASTFVGDPVALLVAETPRSESAESAAVVATPLTAEETAPATGTTSSTLVALLTGDDATPPATASDAPSAAAEPVSTAHATGASAPTGESAVIGPAAPAGDSLLPAEGAVATFHESRQSRTSSLKIEDVLLAPTLDSSNLRQADAKDLSGVWSETQVPMHALSSKTKILTPNVGRVRVILTSKDIFEGKLYAVGQGSVWLESEYGRISVDGKRIASVANIDTKEGTPALGSTGSQKLTGLERVRVKTPGGGSFYGKVIARDETQTTVITEDGSRLTLANHEVEILTDTPKVTIGGKVEDLPKKP